MPPPENIFCNDLKWEKRTFPGFNRELQIFGTCPVQIFSFRVLMSTKFLLGFIDEFERAKESDVTPAAVRLGTQVTLHSGKHTLSETNGQYRYGDLLGKGIPHIFYFSHKLGAFGRVYRAFHTDNGCFVAIKVMDKEKLSKDQGKLLVFLPLFPLKEYDESSSCYLIFLVSFFVFSFFASQPNQ